MNLAMNTRRGISLLCFFIGLFFIVSVSFAKSNPELVSTNKCLDMALYDADGNELPKDEFSNFRLFHEDNAYPGWGNSYKLNIKNTGSGAINYNIKLHYDTPEQGPDLAEVLTMTVEGNNHKTSGKISELNDKVLQEAVTLFAQETHTFDITLAMDEEAGNEYQNLSLDVLLQIAAEQGGEHHDPEPPHDDNDDHDPPIRVKPDPDPKPKPEPEEVPEEPEIIPDIPLPDRGDEPGPDAEIQETPVIEVLPKTGGVPYQLMLAIGIVFIAVGFWLRKSKHAAD